MSDLRVASLKGRKPGSAPSLPDGAVVSGVTTSASFGGNVTGNITGTATGNVTGNVTGNITGTAGTFSGNVSVGGAVTYENTTSIDSVGVVTARTGIKIGAGQSVSAVSGIVTYYGDGSKLTGVESGVVNFVASGTIPNGATVIIKADGTAAVVAQVNINSSAGTPVVFNAGQTVPDVTFDSTNNKVVVTYIDNSNSGKGTAIVGTVSGTSISFGSEVVFDDTGITGFPAVEFVGSGKVVVAYSRSAGTAIVGTVSGTSISFGSRVQFLSSTTSSQTIVYDSTNDKVVISYRNDSNNTLLSIVGTVSGSSISFGSAAQWHSNGYYPDSTYAGSGKIVVTWRDTGNGNKGTAIVGTVSGTSISFGSKVIFQDSTTSEPVAAFDSTNNKIVIAYQWSLNSNKGNAIVGTVSGTSISFGTKVEFANHGVDYTGITFDPTENKVVIVYRNQDNDAGTAIEGTVSGTSISFGSPVVFSSSGVSYNRATYDSFNNKVVISYKNDGNSNYGTSSVYTVSGTSTNLTSENYIGIAAEAIANGATGKINIVTGTNTGQTGLTTSKTYYVQSSGGISTSISTPSVVAGTAISDTKIVVR